MGFLDVSDISTLGIKNQQVDKNHIVTSFQGFRAMIDIGCNLIDPMYSGVYRDKQVHPCDMNSVLKRAWESGLSAIIITSGTVEESTSALMLSRADDRLWCTVGVHPTRITESLLIGCSYEATLSVTQRLKEAAYAAHSAGKLVAWGEFGLDDERTHFCSMEAQLEGFRLQFEVLASIQEKLGIRLPLFLHVRGNVVESVVEVLQEFREVWSAAVAHSFTGSQKQAEMLLSLDGMHIGINGCSLRSESSLAMLPNIPSDRLMIETDGPWCGIRPTHPGFKHISHRWDERKAKSHSLGATVKGRVEPCHVHQVLDVLASVLDIDPETLNNQIFQTTLNVFFPEKP